MRLLYQGFTLYALGELVIELEQPEVFRNFGEIVAFGGEEGIEVARAMIGHYEEKFDETVSVLPGRPFGRLHVEPWLLQTRLLSSVREDRHDERLRLSGDLHIGHKFVAGLRGFSTFTEEDGTVYDLEGHSQAIFDAFSVVKPDDIVWVLGDICISASGWVKALEILKACTLAGNG